MKITIIRAILLITIFLQLSACVSLDRTKPAPTQNQSITINYTDEELSGWSDLPVGAHRVPDSQVIVSGHQSNGLIGVLLGPLGLVIQDTVDSSRASNNTKEARNSLNITLTNEAKKISKKLLESPEFENKFTTKNKAETPKLDVTTAVILTFVTDTDIRPYVLLQVNMTDSNSNSIWKTRYIASSGEPKPLLGSNGWIENGGGKLKETISANLKNAIEFMLTDIAQPYSRDDSKIIIAQGYFPYVRKRLQVGGYQLLENNDYIAFLPRVGDAMIFSGVNIMGKSVTTFRTSEPDDSFFKVLD
ncbi:MAG: hypothetical protein COA90_00770 [Gammaproteobacteria bacterium]|nr:MAG: hypothetical protein COA90_00770 [Gammaproteobacteria bacterium]